MKRNAAMKYQSRINVEAHIPMLPNYIKFGSKYELTLPVSQISKRVLRQIGRAWTAQLVSRGTGK